jgi:F-type H+-transporting ATPase subunit gamma
MAALNEVRDRIKSVKSTQQITKAMKLVSASKLKKATGRITTMRPYSDKLQDVLSNIMQSTDLNELQMGYNEVRPIEKVLVIVMSSDRGLCGGFNSNLIKSAKSLIHQKYPHLHQDQKITVLPIGKKSMETFGRLGIKCDTTFWELFYNLTFENASKVATFLMESYLAKEYDAIEVVYAKFKNAAVQEFTQETFLPIAKKQETVKATQSNADYIFEPSKEDLLLELIPKILKTTFFRYCLDNNASEHGARMVAMDAATNNAGDLIKKLEIEYNKARQAAITNQIMEIVGGAAALDA